MSLDGGTNFTSLLQGLVDIVSIDLERNLARVSGRDFTASLIEARTKEAFSNRTSSEIASVIATRHGLVPAVVPTSTFVGRYYGNQRESLTLDRFSTTTTEWDLLVSLAREDGYDVFVAGNTLFFQPTGWNAAIDLIIRPTDVMHLRLERTLTLARDIEVTVTSWNSLQMMAFKQSVLSTIENSNAATEGSAAGGTQTFCLVKPNLTPDAALKLAQQHLAEQSQHERVVEFSMPGELSLTPRSRILLEGTYTDFDQVYFVESISRSFRPKTGFLQRVRMRNASPRTEQVLAAVTVTQAAD
jgi:phage protein D